MDDAEHFAHAKLRVAERAVSECLEPVGELLVRGGTRADNPIDVVIRIGVVIHDAEHAGRNFLRIFGQCRESLSEPGLANFLRQRPGQAESDFLAIKTDKIASLLLEDEVAKKNKLSRLLRGRIRD